MKRGLLESGFVLILALFLCQAGPVNALAKQKSWTLQFSTGYSPSSHFALEARWYFDNVAKHSDGRIKVIYHYGGALAKLGQELNAMRARTIDCAMATPGYFAAQVPLNDALNMTYVTTAVDAAMKAGQEVYENYAPLHKEWDQNNTIVLWMPPVTDNTLWSTFPVPDIASMKDKKVRALGRTGECISAFGGAPVGILWGDIYLSAQRGIISAAYGTPFSLGWNSKFYEVMPYVTQTWCGVFGSMVTIIRKDLFEQFPPDLQKVFHVWARKAEKKSLQIVMEENRKAVDDMVKRGIKLTIWSPKEREKATALMEPRQFDNWVKQMGARGLGTQAQQLKDMYLKAIKKYEKHSTYESAFDYWIKRYPKG
jgi:TRAP-type C4-dicarboxylate transport system substrate-binding protein